MSQLRKPRPPATNVTVRLDAELLNDVDRSVRQNRGVFSRATWIRQAILERLELERRQQPATAGASKR